MLVAQSLQSPGSRLDNRKSTLESRRERRIFWSLPASDRLSVQSVFILSGYVEFYVKGQWLAAPEINTLRTASFKLFKRPLPGFLTILIL